MLHTGRYRPLRRNGAGRTALTAKTVYVMTATPAPEFDRLAQDAGLVPQEAYAPVVSLPEGVKVVQHAAYGGLGKLTFTGKGERLLERLAADDLEPLFAKADRPALITLKAIRDDAVRLLEGLLPPERALHYFGQSGSNAVHDADIMAVVGTPQIADHDVILRAAALHAGEEPLDDTVRYVSRPYGGQAYQAEVREFADPRLQAVARTIREDEMLQAVGRARLLSIDPQAPLDMSEGEAAIRSHPPRRTAEVHIYSDMPLEGLRIDELVLERAQPATAPQPVEDAVAAEVVTTETIPVESLKARRPGEECGWCRERGYCSWCRRPPYGGGSKHPECATAAVAAFYGRPYDIAPLVHNHFVKVRARPPGWSRALLTRRRELVVISRGEP